MVFDTQFLDWLYKQEVGYIDFLYQQYLWHSGRLQGLPMPTNRHGKPITDEEIDKFKKTLDKKYPGKGPEEG